MKIVTYNVNGLRQRIAQFGSLLKFLNSLQADIICIQETKVSRHDLSADLFTAEGYEAFFSCTRTTERGRVTYSGESCYNVLSDGKAAHHLIRDEWNFEQVFGVVTFCRVRSAFSSTEVTLPLAAAEGFTGILSRSSGGDATMRNFGIEIEDISEITKEDLCKVDSEGRCIITDHGHFVIFNLYGPRADCDDIERVDFKAKFFKILQKRWEVLLSQGRRVFVVGDLNIAPAAVDVWDAKPKFEENQFRKWMRSLLSENGGPFCDVFRTMHPNRRDAYTCWSISDGAEEFNCGTRIDHILIGGSCLHENYDIVGHSFLDCHVKECDILTEFKRWKPECTPRWKGGRSIRLEGSDHAPVYVLLDQLPDLPIHNTPSLAARYVPEVRGRQQTIVSLLSKRKQVSEMELTPLNQEVRIECATRAVKESCSTVDTGFSTSEQETHAYCPNVNVDDKNMENSVIVLKNKRAKHFSWSSMEKKKKERNEYSHQCTLTSFFQKGNPSSSAGSGNAMNDVLCDQVDISKENASFSQGIRVLCSSGEPPVADMEVNDSQNDESSRNLPILDESDTSACTQENEKVNVMLEWQRIQSLMQRSIPLCHGHGEPCAIRSVKKGGPNLGRGFYVCARSKGPSSNPEARCDHFQWASSKPNKKQR